MDDVEKAILISFDESGAIDSALKSQAVSFCQQIKETPTVCRLCIEKLCFCRLVQVQFWCLQTLHELIRVKYALLSLQEKDFMRKSVFSMCCFEAIDDQNNNAVRILEGGPAFIKNKLAQVFVALVYFEYPLTWSSVFVDFLPHLRKGAVVIDMFCRILNALDDELISLDFPRTSEEMGVAGRVKDAMRQQCITQIVTFWYDVVSMYWNSDPDLCSGVLDSMRRYISWIDIGLIVNDLFIPLLFQLILVDGGSDQLQGAAAGCVLAVVSKRMDHQSKLSILQSLQINRVFGLVTGDGDSELVSKVATLITGYAAEVLQCYKWVNTDDAKGVSLELLNEVLPSVFYAMRNFEVGTTFSIVQFLSCYVATMKSLSPLREKQLRQVGQILEVICARIRYDPIYRDNLDMLDKIGREEEERMAESRKDLFLLLRSVGRVAPDVTQIFIRNSLASSISSMSERNVEEVEASLSLLHALGESLSDEAIKTGSGLLHELVPNLLSTSFPCHSNRLVALVYLETITRYMKFVQENTRYVPMVLAAFLDERGIHHPNFHVSRRASYLFMRVVKLLKAKLVPFIENILQSLQDTVARFTTMNHISNEFSGSEDAIHIFEAIGLLIGMEDLPPEKQSDYLSSLLTPLCHQVEALLINANVLNPEESPVKIANIQQIIMAINALSKGFSERLVTTSRPAIGVMFKKTLDILLQILVVFPKIEPLRNKVTSFIHRMVDTLGASVFPCLPKALGQLLAESEEIRELQELQKTFYTFLHVITTHDLSSVFLSTKSRGYLDKMMHLLLHSACNHKDILVRKACVQIFIRLIKDWCTRPYGEEKVPGFQRFIIDGFAMNCCFDSALDKSFEFHDANTLILFGEIVLAQKVMYEKFGDDFLAHFVTKCFTSAHCPQDLASQYCQKLQGNDMKALRSFYQSHIENLRFQQNGSLVFK
uniref:Exportin-T n=1 Tax=Populus trichocarpa TaxID=3694 RepID=A0A3N7FXP5_POPTR